MSQKINVNFFLSSGLSSNYFILIIDQKGNMTNNTYLTVNSSRTQKLNGTSYNYNYKELKYNVGDIVFIFSSVDNITFYINNSFVTTQAGVYDVPTGRTVLLLIYGETPTNNNLINIITEITTQFNITKLQDVTQYITFLGSSSSGCKSPNYIVGDISQSQAICVQYNLIVNIYNQYNISVGNGKPIVNTQNRVISSYTWIWIMIIGLVIIFIVLIIIVLIIRKR